MSDNKRNFDDFFDKVIKSAKDLGETIVEKTGEFAKESGLQDLKDYYPIHQWPPTNLYKTDNGFLVFEFSLSGYTQEDVIIDFDNENMYLSVKRNLIFSTGAEEKYLRRGVRFKDIQKQKYYLPETRFSRENYEHTMENGLLRLIFKEISI